MFMTTTLAHYQLPIFGNSSTALQTTIGADQRALWLRPVTPGAAMTERPPATTVQAAERVTPPMAYKQWLKLLSAYEDQAKAEPVAQADALPTTDKPDTPLPEAVRF